MKNNNYIFLLILSFFILFSMSIMYMQNDNFVNAVNTNAMENVNCKSNAKSMCLLEQSTGRILYGKNIDMKLPMASTTKVFTALTVLENCNDLNKTVEVDNRAVGIEGTSIYLRQGEKLTVKELLYGMMLPSGNDASLALAYYISKDIPSFCELMETTALKAGARNTKFKNPHGLDEIGHYTTAYDLAKVTAKAMENDIFKEISTTKNIRISGNDEVEYRYLRNKNKLLQSFDGCNGVKTGFTDNAGRCFVSSATRNNFTVVCSVLNCQPMFEECAYFMEKAFSEYKMYDLLPAYNIVDTISVEKGKESEVKVFSRKAYTYPLTETEHLQINYVYDIPEVLKAPVKKEEKVGKVKIYLNNFLLFEDEIITVDSVRKDSIFENIKEISRKF